MRAILTFHSIDSSGSVLSFDARLFDELLAVLAARQIPVLDLETLIGGSTETGVAITFDDGMRSVYENALPVLSKYRAPAHVFLSTGAIGSGVSWPKEPANGIPSFDMLDWNEVERLHEAGIAIECHTHTHPDMRSLGRQQMQEECQQADDIISARLGRKPQFFAYPFGYHNREVRDFVRGRYSGTVTTELRQLRQGEDTAALPRLDTYYLQSSFKLRYINSGPMRAYLALRNRLRTLKGSQCVANQD